MNAGVAPFLSVSHRSAFGASPGKRAANVCSGRDCAEAETPPEADQILRTDVSMKQRST